MGVIVKRRSIWLVIVAALLASVFQVGGITAAEAVTRVNGVRCTVVGNAKANTLRGTSGNDVICGLGGNDTIYGLGGNDIIFGGAGNDAVYGGEGNDKITGDAGSDTLLGNEGDDSLKGGAGNDSLQGNNGDDGLIGGAGSDALNGQAPGESDDPSQDDLCEPVAPGDVVGNCGFDEEPPVIRSVSFSDVSIDTSRANKVVVVTLHVTDELMGVTFVDCGFEAQHASLMSMSSPTYRLVSGTDLDGIWECSYTFPRYSPADEYLPSVGTGDSGFQVTSVKASDSDLWSAAFGVGTVDHVTQTGAGDPAAPTVTAVKFERPGGDINTNKADRVVSVLITAQDDLSGIRQANCSYTSSPTPSIFLPGSMKLVSRRGLVTVWRCKATFPRYSVPSEYLLSYDFRDSTGRMKRMQAQSRGVNQGTPEMTDHEISGLGRNWVSQVGSGDVVAPTLQWVNLDRTLINTSRSTKMVYARFRVTDDLSGVLGASCEVLHDYTTGSLAGTTGGMGFTATLVARNGLSSTWICPIEMSRGSAAGPWRVGISFWDRVGHMRILETQSDRSWSGAVGTEASLPGVTFTNGQ